MSWLTNQQLVHAVERAADPETKQAFVGVFPVNRLPHSIPKPPIFIIMNTQSHNLPGEHWKLIYISRQRVGEVFDSAGLIPNVTLQQWMNTFCITWSFTTRVYQNPMSGTCGAYVLYVLLNRLHSLTLSRVLSPFTNSLVANDSFVRKFYDTISQ